MLYLTTKETNSVINTGILRFAKGTSDNFLNSFYLTKEDSRKTQLLWLYCNALNSYDPDNSINYITDKEALIITSKLHGYVC